MVLEISVDKYTEQILTLMRYTISGRSQYYQSNSTAKSYSAARRTAARLRNQGYATSIRGLVCTKTNEEYHS